MRRIIVLSLVLKFVLVALVLRVIKVDKVQGELTEATATAARADYPTAEPLFERSLSIQEAKLAPVHPDLAETRRDLALLRAQLKNAAAKAEQSDSERHAVDRQATLVSLGQSEKK